ncbi:hypothetical protein [Allorhizobium ampelinum]|nr:hypothetical protein [Allorhizobium ampelinum]
MMAVASDTTIDQSSGSRMQVFTEYNGKRFVTNMDFLLADEDDYATYLLNATRLNQELGKDPFFWASDRTAVLAQTDFKPGKYHCWVTRLEARQEIAIPILTQTSEGEVTVLSGRHRIMAMMDNGFEQIPVRAKVALREKLAPLA